MKHKIFTICLLVLLGVVIVSGLALAQQKQANECCQIRAGFTIKKTDGVARVTTDDKVLASGNWVCNDSTPNANTFSVTGIFCDKDGDGQSDLTNNGACTLVTKDWGLVCMLGIIYSITKWLFIIIMLVVTVMIIFGGFSIVTAAGDPEKAGKGKKIIMFAIIGLVVALLARVVPSLVRFVVGV